LTIDPELFRIISLFEELTNRRLGEVAAACHVVSCAQDTEILGEEETTNDVFFILRGSVRINSVTPGGREVIFTDIAAGNIFGEFSAIDHLPRSASVVATSGCTLARMTSQRFFEMLRGDGLIATRLIELLVAKVRRLSERVFEVSALSVRERVRRELCRLAQSGTRTDTGISIRPSPTHYEFAARIGSHREAVTREFNRLEGAGVLQVSRQQIRIIAPEALEDPDQD
jgi:CRP/FNR family cyclic AMP-dependent transcriptional regulator